MTDNDFSLTAMAKINGEAVRRLRETKGFTQLYIATVVGVTTDTVSRWENRRYPFIKRENALRLAEALEVELAAVLEDQPPAETSPHPERSEAAPRWRRRHAWIIGGLLLVLLNAGLAALLLQNGQERLRVEAFRLLPAHVPPGQPFPVLIHITGEIEEATSLILKEELPAACTLLQWEPAYTSLDRQGRVVKWISRIGRESTSFIYLAQPAAQAQMGELLRFRGTVILGQGSEAAIEVAGPHTLEIAPYHWADQNRDGRIDDEEILTVYDLFGLLENGSFDWQLIEEIWAAEGYRWIPETGGYEIMN
jgi:transcriptional regulator with XRE-family HTH domain